MLTARAGRRTVGLARRRVRLAPLMADDRLTPPFVRGHDHALGDGGPVLVLFGDYEDPDIGGGATARSMALRERWDGFTYAWRHLPIGELHPHANGAALAAEGAAAQDAFWAYHHVLLARQDALSVPDLLNYAGQIGLEVAQLMEDMLEGRHAERVLDDVRSAVELGRARRRRRCSSRACAGRAAGSRTRWRARCVQPWPGEVLEERAGEIAVGFAALLTRQAALAPPARGDDHGALARAGAPARCRSTSRCRRSTATTCGSPSASGSCRWRCWPSGRSCTSTCACEDETRGAAAALRRGAAGRARAAVPDARPRPRGREPRRRRRAR